MFSMTLVAFPAAAVGLLYLSLASPLAFRATSQAGGPRSPQISPGLLGSPQISPYLPVSPQISPCLPVSPRISPGLPVSSPDLPRSPHTSRHMAECLDKLLRTA